MPASNGKISRAAVILAEARRQRGEHGHDAKNGKCMHIRHKPFAKA